MRAHACPSSDCRILCSGNEAIASPSPHPHRAQPAHRYLRCTYISTCSCHLSRPCVRAGHTWAVTELPIRLWLRMLCRSCGSSFDMAHLGVGAGHLCAIVGRALVAAPTPCTCLAVQAAQRLNIPFGGRNYAARVCRPFGSCAVHVRCRRPCLCAAVSSCRLRDRVKCSNP